jgi:hypothetical protein
VNNNTCTTGYKKERAGVLQIIANIKHQCSSEIDVWIKEIEKDVIKMGDGVQGLNSKFDNLTTLTSN